MEKLRKLLSEVLSGAEIEEIIRAYEFAKKKHTGQTRIGGGDYIEHPLRVALASASWAKTSNPELVKTLAIVSLLHDAIEDTDATFTEVSELFGEVVGGIVKSLSHEDEEEPDEIYLARVKNGGKIAVAVKMFDKADNVKCLVQTPEKFRRKKIKEIKNSLPIWEAMNPEGAEIIKKALEEIAPIVKKTAVYCGRFNPMHVGHGSVVKEMISQFGIENCLIVIGSSNAGFSLRHFFSYQERRGFMRKAFPGIRVVGLPDYPTDEEWLTALDDITSATSPDSSADTLFFGGCEEDILFFYEAGRTCQILNRFDGTTPKISATEVRDCLIYGRTLEGMVDPTIASEVQNLFRQKWEKFKKI